LFRRHVRHFAFDNAGARHAQLSGHLGHAEVGQAADAIDTDQNVLRREVAMHEVERLTFIVLEFVRRV
jgi:hypothetical protein